jgi:hypothetical protein
MSLLEIKLMLMLTPPIVRAGWLVARRWGGAIGRWLVGLPLTSAAVSVFLAVEQGPHFAAEAANGSLAGVLAQLAGPLVGVRRFGHAGHGDSALRLCCLL